jgi:hypothetical protein
LDIGVKNEEKPAMEERILMEEEEEKTRKKGQEKLSKGKAALRECVPSVRVEVCICQTLSKQMHH